MVRITSEGIKSDRIGDCIPIILDAMNARGEKSCRRRPRDAWTPARLCIGPFWACARGPQGQRNERRLDEDRRRKRGNGTFRFF